MDLFVGEPISKTLTLVYRPVPEKPVSLIFWLFPSWWQFEWIQSKVFMKIESRLGGWWWVLFRESRVRRNLIAALMCGWKRNARIENVKRVIKIAIISICFSSQAEIHLACRLALVRQPKVATRFHDDGVGHPLLHNFTRASLIYSVLVAIILTRLNFPLCGGRLNNISRLLYSLKIATNHLVYDSVAKSFSTSHRWAGMGEKNANGNGIHGGCRKFFIGRQGLARDFSNRFFAVRGWKNEARIQTAQRGHTRCGCPIHKHTHTQHRQGYECSRPTTFSLALDADWLARGLSRAAPQS